MKIIDVNIHSLIKSIKTKTESNKNLSAEFRETIDSLIEAITALLNHADFTGKINSKPPLTDQKRQKTIKIPKKAAKSPTL